MHIAIAGAGIGGLATALALAREDVQVTVLEKQLEWTSEGVGIQLGPNATCVLRSLDLLDEVKQVAARPTDIVIRDLGTGDVLSELPLGDWAVRTFGAPYLTVHRADLHRILLQHAVEHPAVKVHFGKAVVGFDERSDEVALTCADGSEVRADVMVGADGIWSKARRDGRFWARDDFFELEPIGAIALRALVRRADVPSALASNTVGLWMGEAAHIVHYPIRGGDLINVVVIVDGESRDEGWSGPVDDHELSEVLGDLHRDVRALCEAAGDWRQWTLRHGPVARHMGRGRVALVGDAAHPILPFQAQGAAMALEDAACFATVVGGPAGRTTGDATSVDRLMQAYTDHRLKRVERVARTSLRNGTIYHQTGMMRFARNLVLKAAPSDLVMQRFKWLYGFDATKPLEQSPRSR